MINREQSDEAVGNVRDWIDKAIKNTANNNYVNLGDLAVLHSLFCKVIEVIEEERGK